MSDGLLKYLSNLFSREVTGTVLESITCSYGKPPRTIYSIDTKQGIVLCGRKWYHGSPSEGDKVMVTLSRFGSIAKEGGRVWKNIKKIRVLEDKVEE